MLIDHGFFGLLPSLLGYYRQGLTAVYDNPRW